MKKKLLVSIVFILMLLAFVSCSSNKSMLKKMNIKDLPTITNVKHVKKSRNLVSRTNMYVGEVEAFENYALEVYEYLKEKHYDSLGYSTELLETFFGMGGTRDFYNQTSSIDQFKTENEQKVMYQFIFSKNDSFYYNENKETQYLNKACAVIIVYFKDFQGKGKKEYNIGVELFKPKSKNNYAHVNSGVFSSFIFKNTYNLTTKELLINLFLNEYDITILTKEEARAMLGFDDTEDNNLIYYFGYSDTNYKGSKALKIYYDEDTYIKHEINNIENI